jgi:hypothetical protein
VLANIHHFSLNFHHSGLYLKDSSEANAKFQIACQSHVRRSCSAACRRSQTINIAELEALKAVAVRIDGLSLERDLSLVYETERVRGRHTQAFIDFAKTKSSYPISSHQHSSMGERYRYAIELLQL